MSLDKKVAIVTGGATGIGLAIASELAEDGARVVIASRNPDKLRKARESIKSADEQILTVCADVRSKEQVRHMAEAAISTFGQIDILVNNAAIVSAPRPFTEISEEDWDAVLETNLRGYFLCSQVVGKHMIARRYGKIINITSMAALGCVAPGTGQYIVSKAGDVALTQVCAKEFGPYGINVNAIAVGRVHTEMSHTVSGPDGLNEYLEYGRRMSMLGRVGTPEDIARLVAFLASDNASFITGQVVHCDGGRMDRV